MKRREAEDKIVDTPKEIEDHQIEGSDHSSETASSVHQLLEFDECHRSQTEREDHHQLSPTLRW